MWSKKSGIYPYVLDGDERHLNIRAFSDNMKREAYERQKGVCVKCKKKFAVGRNGRRSHQALARGREDQRGELPDAVQGRQQKKIGEMKDAWG